MANVATRDEVKAILGITDTSKDTLIDALLPGVSRMIERYTSREFTLVASGASDRTYWYAGEGILEIGDAATVNTVTLEGRALDDAEWIAQPDSALEPVFYWLELAPLHAMSPEMGFTFNLDKLWPRYRAGRRRASVTVNANWGFPSGGVPDDIKLTAAWLVSEGLNGAPASGMTSESIAEYSISFAQGAGSLGALPTRVTDILNGYRRTNI